MRAPTAYIYRYEYESAPFPRSGSSFLRTVYPKIEYIYLYSIYRYRYECALFVNP